LGKSLAVIGDVIATPGSTPYPPADTGIWTPGGVIYQAYSALSSNGINVIYEAQCIFTFVGTKATSAGPIPVSGSETVSLRAGTTTVNASQNSVLLDGDAETGSYGNELRVAATNPASTA
jgi:hypothetical protein